MLLFSRRHNAIKRTCIIIIVQSVLVGSQVREGLLQLCRRLRQRWCRFESVSYDLNWLSIVRQRNCRSVDSCPKQRLFLNRLPRRARRRKPCCVFTGNLSQNEKYGAMPTGGFRRRAMIFFVDPSPNVYATKIGRRLPKLAVLRVVVDYTFVGGV